MNLTFVCLLRRRSSRPEQAQALKNETMTLAEVLRLTPANNNLTISSLGPEISHIFSIHNFGPSPLLDQQVCVTIYTFI